MQNEARKCNFFVFISDFLHYIFKYDNLQCQSVRIGARTGTKFLAGLSCENIFSLKCRWPEECRTPKTTKKSFICMRFYLTSFPGEGDSLSPLARTPMPVRLSELFKVSLSHEFSEFWLEFFHELLKFFREICNSDGRIATGGCGLDPQLFFKTIFSFRNCEEWGGGRAKNSHIYNFVAMKIWSHSSSCVHAG